jgi:tetratricopeptide (TPR) repeat protein
METGSGEDILELQQRAGAAYEAGRLHEAAQLYRRLVELRPEGDAFHFRLGLVHKYLREWPASLRHNLETLALSGEHDEGSSWNAGIAATALGDWHEARRQWHACGIDIDPGEGPIEENFGPIGLRLNPWRGRETVFALRIDPARGRIANVPLPSSGHRYGDVVLHDGAQVGEREYLGHTVPVFNALQRLEPSGFASVTAFVGCDSEDELEELHELDEPGVVLVEDWTLALGPTCLRCDYAIPHEHRRHEAGKAGGWNPDRTLGIAATDKESARALVEAWVAAAPSRRRLEAIACREQAPPELPAAGVWWR